MWQSAAQQTSILIVALNLDHAFRVVGVVGVEVRKVPAQVERYEEVALPEATHLLVLHSAAKGEGTAAAKREDN